MELLPIQALNLPIASLQLTKKEGRIFVLCLIRRKPILLTPEEWVRQHLLSFLIHDRKVPKGLIRVERSIQVNGMTRRFDVLVSNTLGQPVLLLECKAPEIAINREVFYQIAQYNSQIRAKYFMMSNGLMHYFGDLSQGKLEIGSLNDLPLHSNW